MRSADTQSQTLAATPALRKHLPAQPLEVDVTGLDYLWLSTNGGGDGTGGDHTCWLEPTLTRADGSSISATTLPVHFWKVEWDRLRTDSAMHQEPFKIAGTNFEHGWWAHPRSSFYLKLDRQFRKFTVACGTHVSATEWGKVGFSIESRLARPWLDKVLAESMARDFPEIDRWLASDFGVETNGHHALFSLPADELSRRLPRYTAPHALDRLACAHLLANARKTQALVERAALRPQFVTRLEALTAEFAHATDTSDWHSLQSRIRALRREIIFSHPALDFPDLLVNQQPITKFHHQCDQYLGRHNLSGPGLVVVKNWKSAHPETIELLQGKLPPGSVAHPDLSFDARKIAFAFCDTSVKDWRQRRFFLWEVNADGTGLRQLTGNAQDPMRGNDGRQTVLIEDFDPCYLPGGGIAFVSTRCQTFGRCHAGRYNPSYLLFRCEADGSNIRQLSWGEANEWDPSVLDDGRLIYTRWDYINRHDTFYQSLWTIHPDGTGTAHYYGNYTPNPCMTAEARSVPGSSKIVATATAHHGYTCGSIILIDPACGEDGPAPITRFTPEIPFPETEGHFGEGTGAFRAPWPLNEDLMLVAYTPDDRTWGHDQFYSIYLIDSTGGRERVFHDTLHSTTSPIPLQPRPTPRTLASSLPANANSNTPGRVVIQNANLGRQTFDAPARSIRINEIIGQPTADVPHRSAAYQEIVKRVLGTATVAADGASAFEIPSCKPVQLQLLDEQGMAIMTMRSFIYAQPGETIACVGCHENRAQAPLETARQASTPVQRLRKLKGQEYAGGFNYARSVQPVLDRHCVSCHGGKGKPAANLDLRGMPVDRAMPDYPSRPATLRCCTSYDQLLNREGLVVLAQRNRETGASKPRDYFAAAGKLAPKLLGGHCKSLLADRDGLELVITWLDLNAQCFGDYSWSRPEDGGAQPPANGTCGLKPCRCGCCWVPTLFNPR